MSNKKLRKELEQAVVKGIEQSLKKNNAAAAKKIKKVTYKASKNVVKKFLKNIKPIPGIEMPILAKVSKKQSKIDATSLKTANKK